MKIFNNRASHRAGFTLIELLVVVAIISLLSSIVLASIKEARDKARAKAFRVSVNQFIIALDLYRADKGVYPGYVPGVEVFGFSRNMGSDGNVIIPSLQFQYYDSYKTALSPYIKDLPQPVIPGSSFSYRGVPSYTGSFNTLWNKCYGDTSIRPYIILISSSHPGFEDWSYLDIEGNPLATYRCFSLK